MASPNAECTLVNQPQASPKRLGRMSWTGEGMAEGGGRIGNLAFVEFDVLDTNASMDSLHDGWRNSEKGKTRQLMVIMSDRPSHSHETGYPLGQAALPLL